MLVLTMPSAHRNPMELQLHKLLPRWNDPDALARLQEADIKHMAIDHFCFYVNSYIIKVDVYTGYESIEPT